MLDILIKDVSVIDGTGKPSFRADVGIANGRIINIASSLEGESNRIIQGQGLHLAPGFIDAHTHSDLTLLVDPHAKSKIHQGVTTEVIGNCGSSAAPLIGLARQEIEVEASEFGLIANWTSMAEYLERLRQPGTSVNVVPLVGHNTIRGGILGFDDCQPTPSKKAEMERAVAEAMDQGARGISTGLFYPPGMYSTTAEVVGVARVVARYGGIYASHIRSESDGLFEAVAEAIEIGGEAEIPIQISHVKMEGYLNWEGVDNLLELMEDAISNGVDLMGDQYPYTACSTWLGAILPNWAQAGGGQVIAKRMEDEAIRRRLSEDFKINRKDWDNRSGVRSWEDILITHYNPDPHWVGMTVAEIAAEKNADPLETAFDLIAASLAQVGGVFFDQSEPIVRSLMQSSHLAVGSDGSSLSPEGVLGKGKPHPRSYGTFPRILGRYVREEKVLSLPEAIRKMTSLPAHRFKLADRGEIRPGAWADLVLFDPETIIDQATYTDPHQYPLGISYVLVNGDIVIDNGTHTGSLPGEIL